MGRVGNVYQLEGLPSRSTQNMAEDRWLELRRQGIGGSDIGAIMGINPWRSRFEVYCDKKGIIGPKDLSEDMEFGIYMEPVLRKWAEQKLQAGSPDIPTKVFASPYLYQAPDDRRAIANIDGVVVIHGTEENPKLVPIESGLEIKTASVYMEKEWKDDEVPDHYYAQDQWYMRVTGLASWWMAPLVGKRFFLRLVPRNDAFINTQIQHAAAFNEMLDSNTMPAPSGTESDFDIILGMFPTSTEQFLEDAGFEPALREYQELGAKFKAADDAKKEARAKLELAIGEAKGIIAGALKVSWSRFDVSRADTDRLKAEYPQVWEAVKKTTRQGRLTVSAYAPKKGKEVAA